MKNGLIALFCTWFILLFPLQASAAGSVPYKTETMSADGNVIETQTAYMPIGLFADNSDIVKPEDIFIDKKNHVYIADAEAKKILVFDESGKQIHVIGEGDLEEPTGVFVDSDGKVFVADYKREQIVTFSEKGKLQDTFGKPDSPLFGKKSPFLPQKVGVDKRGNIFVIGEGSTNGIIQLGHDGTFLGYYGVNTTQNSLKSFLQNLITSDEQKKRMFLKTPPAPGNIAIDERGLIYTITEGTKQEVIKKLNVAGQNLLPPDISDIGSFKDITIDPNGNIFVLNEGGKIVQFDSYGNMLFSFAGKDEGSNRLGLFQQPTGIAVNDSGLLYVTDGERGTVQIFHASAFGQKVNEGIALYKEGLYVESQRYWREVLRMNTSFGLAHTAMGESLYKQQKYEEALEEYRVAEDRGGYSNAFWEIRQMWMKEHLSKVFLILAALLIVRILLKYADRKKNILKGVREKRDRIKGAVLVKQLLYMTKFLKHPIDSFYYIKKEHAASVTSASILYVVLLIEYLIAKYLTGFIFRSGTEGSTLFLEVATVFSPILLFLIANYLVSTITDGEGTFKQIYIGTIYSLAPYLLFILPLTLISNVLTFNESFIYVFSIRITYAWCLLILFFMIKEIHNFSISETIRNIFVTLFGMVILVLVLFVVYVLLDQVYEFVYSIIQEVILRV
ncbi:YIP1 family protein [Rossellomorea marisflavi]|uniref:YIP1 family protein n=1 Tax=Rossellomorea marisflavi TaxID=189381 RepID=UPI0035174240